MGNQAVIWRASGVDGQRRRDPVHLGMMYHRRGRQDAMRVLRTALRLDEASPDAAEARRALAASSETGADSEGSRRK